MADSLIEARGKARVDFEIGGIDKVEEKLRSYSANVDRTQNQVLKLQAAVTAAIIQQSVAEEKLNATILANAASSHAEEIATTNRDKAHAAAYAALIAETEAQTRLNAELAKGNTGGLLIDKSALATERRAAADRALEDAERKLAVVIEANQNINLQEVAAQQALATSTENVRYKTEQLSIANSKLTVQQNYQKAYSEQATQTQGKFSNALSTVKDKFGELGGAVSRHTSVLTVLGRTINSASQGFTALGANGSKAGQLINTGFVALPSLFMSAGGALGGLVAGMAALGASSISAISNLHQVVLGVKQFQNAVGGTTQDASALGVLGRLVGQNANDIGISLGFINQQLYKLDNTAAKAGNSVAKSIDTMGDSIKKLSIDRVQRLNELSENLKDQWATIVANIKDAAESRDLTIQNASDDRQQKINDAIANRSNTAIQIEEDKNQQLEALLEQHTQRVSDLNDQKTKLEHDHAADITNLELDLQQKLLDIDKKYDNERLGLQEKYLNASPLLRPFIQKQIDALQTQEDAEKQKAEDDTSNKKSKLEYDYKYAHDKLVEALTREEDAYSDHFNKINDAANKHTQVLRDELAKQIYNANEAYDKQVRGANQAYAKQLDVFREQQVKLQLETSKSVKKVEDDYIQALDAIKSKVNEVTSGAFGGGGGATSSPLAQALVDLNLNLAELDKMDGPHKLYAIAKALNDYTGNNKTGILNTLGGFFSPTIMNFLEVLGKSGSTFEEFEANMTKIAPSLQFTKDEVNRIFQNFMNWNSVGIIITDLGVRLGKDLLPVSEKLVKSIQDWWANPENREKAFKIVDDLANVIEKLATGVMDLLSGKKTFNEIIETIFPKKDQDKASEDIKKLFSGLVETGINAAIAFISNPDTITTIATITQKLGEAAGAGMVIGIKKALNIDQGSIGDTVVDIIFPDPVKWGNATTGLYRDIDTIITTLKADFFTLQGNLEIAWNNIKTGVSNAWGDIKTNILGKVTQIGTEIPIRIYLLVVDLQTRFHNFKDTIAGIFTQLVTDVLTFPSRISNGIVGKWEELRIAGLNAFNGFKNGFRQAIDNFINGLSPVVRYIMDAWNNSLQIHSPSKLFEVSGSYAGAGFIAGFNKSMNSMINATIPDMTTKLVIATDNNIQAQQARNGVSNTNNYSNSIPAINIYTSPSQAPQDIARAVFDEIRNRTPMQLN